MWRGVSLYTDEFLAGVVNPMQSRSTEITVAVNVTEFEIGREEFGSALFHKSAREAAIHEPDTNPGPGTPHDKETASANPKRFNTMIARGFVRTRDNDAKNSVSTAMYDQEPARAKLCS